MIRIPHPLASSARARPNHPALVLGECSVTYQTLLDRVARRAGYLRSAGVRAGDTIALSEERNLSWIVELLAIGWCDAVAALLPISLSDEERSARLATREVQWWSGASAPDHVPHLDAETLGAACVEPMWDLESERFVVWTSGSEGNPKAVALTTAQWVFNAMGSALRLEHRLTDRWLGVLPLEHVGGLSIVLRCLLYGTTAVIDADFDPSRVAKALQAGGISHVSLVPSMLERILEESEASDFHPDLRVVLLGGAPASAALLETCAECGIPVVQTWGMTETASQVCTTFPNVPQEPTVVGPPLPFCRVDVVDGRLVVDGATTVAPVVSADAGQVLDHGAIQVTGRADSTIISGGLKIAPADIENVLRRHPEVSEVVVLGRADPSWGQRPVAFVTTAQHPLEAEVLEHWLRERLSHYKVPRSWIFCDRIPRTSLGKIDGSALRRGLSLFVDEPDGFQGVVEFDRAEGWGHLRNADESMLQMDHRTGIAFGTDHVVATGDRAFGEAVDAQLDGEAVPMADHPLERRFGMDQGESDRGAIVDALETTESSREHLLEADVRVLKDSIEEENARSIDFVETSGNRNIERHNRALSPKDA